MGLKERILGKKKFDLSKIGESELRQEKIMLENSVRRLSNEIKQLEARKKKLFQDGVGKDVLEKKMLAEEIKVVERGIRQKYRIYQRKQQQLKIVNNMILIKKNEEDLKREGLWNKITEMDPVELEKWLSWVQLEDQMLTEQLGELDRRLMETAELEEEMDEETMKIMDLWAKAETSGIEEVEAELALEKTLKREKDLEQEEI